MLFQFIGRIIISFTFSCHNWVYLKEIAASPRMLQYKFRCYSQFVVFFFSKALRNLCFSKHLITNSHVLSNYLGLLSPILDSIGFSLPPKTISKFFLLARHITFHQINRAPNIVWSLQRRKKFRSLLSSYQSIRTYIFLKVY